MGDKMERKPLESDWKTFKKRVPQWRERFLEIRIGRLD
jgi:hypothetical protein